MSHAMQELMPDEFWDRSEPVYRGNAHGGPNKGKPGVRWGEIYAIRAENQIGAEIIGEAFKPRDSYGDWDASEYDPDKKVFPQVTCKECEEWYEELPW